MISSKKSDPTKESKFRKVVGVFLSTPPKPHKAKVKKKRSPVKKKPDK
jgi:hypothetical protein